MTFEGLIAVVGWYAYNIRQHTTCVLRTRGFPVYVSRFNMQIFWGMKRLILSGWEVMSEFNDSLRLGCTTPAQRLGLWDCFRLSRQDFLDIAGVLPEDFDAWDAKEARWANHEITLIISILFINDQPPKPCHKVNETHICKYTSASSIKHARNYKVNYKLNWCFICFTKNPDIPWETVGSLGVPCFVVDG